MESKNDSLAHTHGLWNSVSSRVLPSRQFAWIFPSTIALDKVHCRSLSAACLGPLVTFSLRSPPHPAFIKTTIIVSVPGSSVLGCLKLCQVFCSAPFVNNSSYHPCQSVCHQRTQLFIIINRTLTVSFFLISNPFIIFHSGWLTNHRKLYPWLHVLIYAATSLCHSCLPLLCLHFRRSVLLFHPDLHRHSHMTKITNELFPPPPTRYKKFKSIPSFALLPPLARPLINGPLPINDPVLVLFQLPSQRSLCLCLPALSHPSARIFVEHVSTRSYSSKKWVVFVSHLPLLCPLCSFTPSFQRTLSQLLMTWKESTMTFWPSFARFFFVLWLSIKLWFIY